MYQVPRTKRHVHPRLKVGWELGGKGPRIFNEPTAHKNSASVHSQIRSASPYALREMFGHRLQELRQGHAALREVR